MTPKFSWASSESMHLLIQASQVFPALEELIFNAQTEVLLAFRVLDPETKLRSEIASANLRTWADLIAHKVHQGINVRLLLADFEPILATDLHQQSWSSINKFVATCSNNSNFQTICAQHEARFAPLARALFWPMFVKALFARRADVQTGKIVPRLTPGLRSYFALDGTFNFAQLLRPAAMHPATYHQKMAIIDGAKAIVGGLDIDERRYDTADHEQAAAQTWHDASMCVEGEVAKDLRQHYSECWSQEAASPSNEKRLQQMCDDNGLKAPAIDALPLLCENGKRPSAASAKVIRTVSENAAGVFSLSPRPKVQEIYAETVAIINSAKTSLYIETQFFRSKRLAKLLAKRAAKEPALTCILLLPFAPEEIAFDKHDHPAHRHGEWLQGQCLKILKKGFGERLGVFSLAKKTSADTETGRAREYDAGVIHIHSKILMADDLRATITSANLNERSLQWDTEVGLSLRNSEVIQNSRFDLWERHLKSADVRGWGLEDGLTHWKKIALDNVNQPPTQRKGFVLPHRTSRTIKYGRPAVWIPDEMV